METYNDWRDSHPIREWARGRGIALSMVAAKLEITGGLFNEWLRSNPPDDERFVLLCKLMEVKPAKLREQIAAWRERGAKLEI